jgi:ABC-type nitrate/sulfonate/bicarbonate transport system substrate-binding protein
MSLELVALRMPLLRSCVAIATILFVANGASAQTVRVGIPERDNLQYLSFWVAHGAGLFEREGLTIEIVVADAPNQSGMILMQKRVDISLLQPPAYLG